MELCPRCLGRRLVGAIGQDAQEAAAAERPTVAPADCAVCCGRWDVDAWLQAALDALDGVEAQTFQVGTRFPAACEAAEKAAMAAINPEIGDTIRTEANRLLGPLLAEATGMELRNDARPEVVVQVDTRFWHAEATTNSVYIEGRYTKARRDMPQAHWPCKTCQGNGCYQCDDAGVMYAISVEEAIAEPARRLFDAPASAFHGAGREDIDAIMGGTGRPFVLELKNPTKRQADLAALEAEVNATAGELGVTINSMRPSSKDRVQELKAGTYDKEYVAHCEAQGDVTPEQVEAAARAMDGVMLEQRTPDRVSHRRADLVRKRRVHKMTVERFDDARHFSVRVLADSGAYIKEMVSGDEGRTTPNLAEALGVPTVVKFLDVTAILDDAQSPS